jgi:hypothetical protein
LAEKLKKNGSFFEGIYLWEFINAGVAGAAGDTLGAIVSWNGVAQLAECGCDRTAGERPERPGTLHRLWNVPHVFRHFPCTFVFFLLSLHHQQERCTMPPSGAAVHFHGLLLHCMYYLPFKD